MSENQSNTALLPRDESFHKLIALHKNMSFTYKLNDPRFTVKDTHLSSRVISHWNKNNILPDGLKGERGWHTFTLTEIVWLKIASRLRGFGFSLKKISEIKKQILWFDKTNKYRNYPFLDSYLARAMVFPEDSFVIVLADGTADIGSALEVELVKDKLLPSQKDMLLVSLKGILDEMGISNKSAKMMMPMSYDEILSLRTLDAVVKNKNEVNIKFKNGRVKEIESRDIISENPDFKIINEFFKTNNEFGEVTTKYADGKRQTVEVMRRKRF